MTTVDIPDLCTESSDATGAQVQRLIDLASHGLAQMFDDQNRLFCFRFTASSKGLLREGQSPRYSVMTLLGLNRLEQSGVSSPVEITPVLEGLLRNTDWVDNIGDLGLLVWLCAHVDPEALTKLDERLGISNALQRYSDAQRGQTMELAWLLTGLCYWAQASPEVQPRIERLTFEVYERLKSNQGRHGIFGHSARRGSLAGRARGWIGSFADQVYPIYAMALFAKAYGDPEAEARALQCGRAICEAQGARGQWWWHYDSSTGYVIDGYPVFSVHQHGMAPMALLALSEMTRKDFSPWIHRGLEWIGGRNELQLDMENSAAKVVWRCICRKSSGLNGYVNAALQRRILNPTESGDALKVLFECRPYELGWLLYAFAGRITNPSCPMTSDSLMNGARP